MPTTRAKAYHFVLKDSSLARIAGRDRGGQRFFIIESVVSDWTGFSRAGLRSHCRTEALVRARQALHYLFYSLLGETYHAVGDYMGCHHTNVAFSCRTIAESMAAFPEVKKEIGILSGRCLEALKDLRRGDKKL